MRLSFPFEADNGVNGIPDRFGCLGTGLIMPLRTLMNPVRFSGRFEWKACGVILHCMCRAAALRKTRSMTDHEG